MATYLKVANVSFTFQYFDLIKLSVTSVLKYRLVALVGYLCITRTKKKRRVTYKDSFKGYIEDICCFR